MILLYNYIYNKSADKKGAVLVSSREIDMNKTVTDEITPVLLLVKMARKRV